MVSGMEQVTNQCLLLLLLLLWTPRYIYWYLLNSACRPQPAFRTFRTTVGRWTRRLTGGELCRACPWHTARPIPILGALPKWETCSIRIEIKSPWWQPIIAVFPYCIDKLNSLPLSLCLGTLKTRIGTSLVVQWLRLRLPMQRLWVWSLVGELSWNQDCQEKYQ